MDAENQWIVNQVRLVYDYAIAQLEKASENKVLVSRHVLDQIVAGLWLVVKDTLGDGFSMDAKIKAREEDPREDAVVEEMDPREDGLVEEKKEWPCSDPASDELIQPENGLSEFIENRIKKQHENDGSVEMEHK